MTSRADNPLVVQSDRSLLLEVHHPRHAEVRNQVTRFAELVSSPEHLHTYMVSPLSLWNAASSGLTAEDVMSVLVRNSRYPVPGSLEREVRDLMGRYGRIKLVRVKDELRLVSEDPRILDDLDRVRDLQPLIADRRPDGFVLMPRQRGNVKQILLRLGLPVEDLAGYRKGAPLSVKLSTSTRGGKAWSPREYQLQAIEAFWADGAERGGSGVICLPCGAGKTVVGIGVMSRFQTQTLIVVPNLLAVRQWREEILERTDLTPDQVGEYSGETKQVSPVTVTTYQVLTQRTQDHLALFEGRDWGLIIYDEVHLLPAPIFRVTADLQATRRLGLTATLVREDGHQEDVFTLIGPKRFDVPWKDLESRGYIAEAICHELRVPMEDDLRRQYWLADKRSRYRLAATNPVKLALCQQLVTEHARERILVIGQYLEQLEEVARLLGAPLLTGKTPQGRRESLYHGFRSGEIPVLVVSKVANFAVDLPDASVAIQLSGTFGSRQEEAQRLGRLLRPKSDGRGALFYALVSQDSVDEEFARHRQRFLAEQGYRYTIGHRSPGERTTSPARVS